MGKILRLENIQFTFSSTNKEDVNKVLDFNPEDGTLRVYSLKKPCRIPFDIDNARALRILADNFKKEFDITSGTMRVVHNQPVPNAYSAPFKVYIDITTICQLKCPFCLSETKDGNIPSLPINIIEKIAEEIKELGIMYVKIGGGDPILHPDFKNIARLFRSAGCFITMSTNSLSITQEVADILAQFSISTSISLEGLEKTDDSLRMPGHFQMAMVALEVLKKAGVNVILRVTLLKQNLKEVPALVEMAKTKEVKIKFAYCRPAGRAISNQMMLRPEDAEEYLRVVEHLNSPEVLPCVLMDEGMMIDQPQDVLLKLFRGRMCGAANRSMHIDASGKVSPCIFLGPTFLSGLIYKDGTIKDFWQGKVGTKFQIVRAIRQPCECDRCERICKNECPANRFYFWGDFGKQDPNCLYFATKQEERRDG